MSVSQEQKERIARFVPVFRRYLDDTERDANMLERQSRRELFAELLSPAALSKMTELDFGQVISSLWASQVWGDKAYLVGKLIYENGLPVLKEQLRRLLWGKGDLAARYDTFRKTVKGLGAASITEIMAFVHPQTCALWNDVARQALEVLSFDVPHKRQISGKEYEVFTETVLAIQNALEAEHGIGGLDMLGMDYFLYAVWETGRDLTLDEDATAPADDQPIAEEDFDHDEVIEELINIGQWLGFQTEKEKMVARGAVVDAIWQARIANLGAVTYVFEVQRHGSIDSLILNLQRAQNNPTVQRLIVVAASDQIERIRNEISTMPESFRKSVAFMEVREVIHAAALISELSGIIGKLELVRSEFDV
ncbi:MAG TPA: hypothetical protein VKQ72_07170 [Aggregatilineales bacterium]|nr:hypothetical protein [Aggregatilineales bacterium]